MALYENIPEDLRADFGRYSILAREARERLKVLEERADGAKPLRQQLVITKRKCDDLGLKKEKLDKALARLFKDQRRILPAFGSKEQGNQRDRGGEQGC